MRVRQHGDRRGAAGGRASRVFRVGTPAHRPLRISRHAGIHPGRLLVLRLADSSKIPIHDNQANCIETVIPMPMPLWLIIMAQSRSQVTAAFRGGAGADGFPDSRAITRKVNPVPQSWSEAGRHKGEYLSRGFDCDGQSES